MNYIKEELKDGVKLHLLINDNFKTDYSVIFLSIPLKKENLSKNALITAVLKDGSKSYTNMKKITEALEMMYGASFECGIDKSGDNIVLKFYISSINDKYLPEPNQNIIKSIEILTDIIFNPLIESNRFKEEYIEIEKNNLELIINAEKDDKDLYAFERCINIMYKNCGFGLGKYGEIEDLKSIKNEELYKYYKELIDTAKIDIYISGNLEKEKVINEIKNNALIKNLNPRNETTNKNHFKDEIKEKIAVPKSINEQMEITQGKLVIGLDILPNDIQDFRFSTILFNAIFGNGVNSKLFQIVREKESLAYTAKSEYIVQKNNIFIRCGIEIKNYSKTVELIKRLLEDMKNGNFTEEDIQKAKEYVYAGIEAIEEEQDAQIVYLFGQELSKLPMTLEENRKYIEEIKKEDIIKIANKIQINTIYFLENGGENANN